ncbi:hypothetical protein H4Q26_003525 [Puccinia striiformis f. sp. tritici PST-130]|nr:hypothetical protein H4Q26_003525 [Puccinia striiformis f. sp. tritici PST-130]
MNSTETTATTTTTNYYEQREQEHDLESTAVRNRLVKNSSTSPKVTLWTDILINAGFIASWYLFATLISLYNKWMFSPDHYNFQYPLFVSACHMYIQFGLAAATLALFPSIRSRTRPTPHDYLKKALPCGMASGLDIGLSNTSLKTVTLSFYTGVILMVSSETQFDLWGMIEVLTASCLGGLRWSLTQILLDKQSMGMNTPIATIFWLAPTMGISLSFCSLLFEGWNNLLNEHAFFGDLGKSFTTMTYISTAGILAYLMTVSEYFLIQRTSVVTLSIAGVFKEVGTIFLSTIIFHDVMTPLNISGLGITLFGIVLYNVLKYKQSLKKTNLSDGRDREGLIVLTNRTKENSQIYSKLEDEDDNENEDEDEQDQDQEERQQLNQTHHALHSNIDEDLESELVRNDSLDENIDPRRRLMLMTERVSSTTRL